jgi:hypothetical protein
MFFGQQDGDVRGGGGRAVAGILSLGRREYGIHLRTGLEQHLGHAVEGLIGRRAQVDVVFGQPRPLLDLGRVLGQPPGLEGFEVPALRALDNAEDFGSSVFSSNPSFTDIMVPAVS